MAGTDDTNTIAEEDTTVTETKRTKRPNRTEGEKAIETYEKLLAQHARKAEKINALRKEADAHAEDAARLEASINFWAGHPAVVEKLG